MIELPSVMESQSHKVTKSQSHKVTKKQVSDLYDLAP